MEIIRLVIKKELYISELFYITIQTIKNEPMLLFIIFEIFMYIKFNKDNKTFNKVN